MKAAIFSAITLFVACTAAQGQQGPPGESAKPPDTTQHSVQFVPVDKNVKLEVLDWGGTGRPLVLLAGMGFDAHAYDAFAPKLISLFPCLRNHSPWVWRFHCSQTGLPKLLCRPPRR